MPDFKNRLLVPEKMDQPDVPQEEIRQALRELEVINKWLGGYNVIFDALKKANWNKQPLTIMDLGCGGGDILRAIARWAELKEMQVNLVGVDRNPLILDFAREHSSEFSNIAFRQMDVFDNRLHAEHADITISSLFCHHFNDDELTQLIKRMHDLSAQAVVVNDIHRHWFAYYSIKTITGLFSKTDLVKYDAPVSVGRSLTRAEWEKVLTKAGIETYELNWMWAWRWQLIINRNDRT
jgi:SAM-dependent methyltransferase